MCLQLVYASKTSVRGASKVRVTTTSVSLGVVNVVACLFVAGIFPPFLCVELCEIEVESLVALIPELPEIAGPFSDLFQRRRVQAARTPLRVSPARDQACLLQDPKVLGYRRTTHLKWLRQLLHGRFPRGEPGQDGATRRIGEGGEGDAELIRSHRI